MNHIKNIKGERIMKTIYVVTSGYYSDYCIEAVFDNEKEAIKFADEIEESHVEEYLLNARKVDSDRKIYDVTFSESGEVSVGFRDDQFGGNEIDTFEKHTTCTVFSLLAKNKKHAIKIASERFMQVKAQPYLFPHWDEACIYQENWRGYRTYPCYNFVTREMIIPDGFELYVD
jgi:hypothetical protein